MKIQDALSQNKDYWTAQAKMLEQRLGTYQEEVQKIATQLNEAQQQIALYDEAQKFLSGLEPVKAETVDAIDAQVPVDAVAIEAKPNASI